MTVTVGDLQQIGIDISRPGTNSAQLEYEQMKRMTASPTDQMLRQEAIRQLTDEERARALGRFDRDAPEAPTTQNFNFSEDEIQQRMAELRASEPSQESKERAYNAAQKMGAGEAGFYSGTGSLIQQGGGLLRPFGLGKSLRDFGAEMRLGSQYLHRGQGPQGIGEKVVNFVGEAIPQVVEMALPGGAWIKFPAIAAAQAAGENRPWREVAQETLKGFGTAGVFKSAELFEKPIARLATVAGGSLLLNAASGAPLDRNIQTSLVNTAYELLGILGPKAVNKTYRFWKGSKAYDVRVTPKGVDLLESKPNRTVTGGEAVIEPENRANEAGTQQGQESVKPTRPSSDVSTTESVYGPKGKALEDEDKQQGLVFRDGKWQYIEETAPATPNQSLQLGSSGGFMDKVRKMVTRYRKTGEHELADALQEGTKGIPSAEERTPNVTLSEKAGRTLDAFRAKAQAYLPKWRKKVEELGHAIGLSGDDIRNPDEIKGRERSAEKYAKALEKGIEDPKQVLKDTLRASFVIETPEQGKRLRELIMRKFPRIVKEENRFKNPLPNDYSDAILHIDLGNGHYAEIQIHVREMLDAKEISHLYYERERTLKDLGRKRTPEQDHEMERMDQAQRNLHAAARRAFTRRTNLSLETMWP